MAGVAVLFFFLLIAYINNSVFLDRLLLCSFILFGIFILKIRENVTAPLNSKANTIKSNNES
jgi:hypothetical protein